MNQERKFHYVQYKKTNFFYVLSFKIRKSIYKKIAQDMRAFTKGNLMNKTGIVFIVFLFIVFFYLLFFVFFFCFFIIFFTFLSN